MAKQLSSLLQGWKYMWLKPSCFGIPLPHCHVGVTCRDLSLLLVFTEEDSWGVGDWGRNAPQLGRSDFYLPHLHLFLLLGLFLSFLLFFFFFLLSSLLAGRSLSCFAVRCYLAETSPIPIQTFADPRLERDSRFPSRVVFWDRGMIP